MALRRQSRIEQIENDSVLQGASIVSRLSGLQPVLDQEGWEKAKMCSVCYRKLGRLHRHHCRFCGKTVCKEHSQHFRQSPDSADSVRCCDSCQKEIVCADTRKAIAAYISSLRASIKQEGIEITRRSHEREDKSAQLISKRQSLESLLAECEEKLAVRRTSLREAKLAATRLNAALSADKMKKKQLRKLVVEYAPMHSALKAEYTELQMECGKLHQSLKAIRRNVIEHRAMLKERVSESEVKLYLNRCCTPKYFCVSFKASGSFNSLQYKGSLHQRPSSRAVVESKSCKCVIF